MNNTPKEEVPKKIRCFSCGSINESDKDGVFQKKCWYCKKILEDSKTSSEFSHPNLIRKSFDCWGENKKSELIKKLKEYIEFLGVHVSDGALFMHTHGIKISDAEVKKGEKFREEIAKLEHAIKQSQEETASYGATEMSILDLIQDRLKIKRELFNLKITIENIHKTLNELEDMNVGLFNKVAGYENVLTEIMNGKSSLFHSYEEIMTNTDMALLAKKILDQYK